MAGHLSTELLKMVTCTFAGRPGALKVFLAMQALAASGKDQTDKLLVPFGPGGDGKTIIFEILSKSIWQSL